MKPLLISWPRSQTAEGMETLMPFWFIVTSVTALRSAVLL